MLPIGGKWKILTVYSSL